MGENSSNSGRITAWKLGEKKLVMHHERGVMAVELCAEDILRVRFSPREAFRPRRSWEVTEALQAPGKKFQVQERAKTLSLSMPLGKVEVERASGRLRFYHHAGYWFAEDISAPQWRTVSVAETKIDARPGDELPTGMAQQGISVDKYMAVDEGYYGFGQRTGKLDRRYRRFTHWNVDLTWPGYSPGHDNLYQSQPCFLALRPGFAWGLFLHSTWYNQFDVGANQENRLRIFTLGGELDYYLFFGPTPAAVVEQLTRLTGRPLLPPLWALGFHQSRWSYRSAKEVETVAREFRARRIPVDAIHLDIDYMRGFRVFTWDPERFPAPKATLARLHEQGIRAVAIVDPGVKNERDRGYDVAESGLAEDVFIRNVDGTLLVGYCWPGEALFPDFTRPSVRNWWGEQLQVLLEAGVDGVWIDMNEPAIFDRPFGDLQLQLQPLPLAAPQGEGKEYTCHVEVHNLYGALMAQATYEGLLRLRPGQRPWVLTRSAYVGTQRYAASWMGDNTSWWEYLEQSLPQLASMGLCGMPHVGVDIGGFHENAHPELYARWMELGAFYPFMRCHTALGTRSQEPWCFGSKVEKLSRQAIQLRYRLLPYLYTLAYLAHRTGAPLVRPLLYEFPEQPALYGVEDQWMVGPQLLVAPVYQPGLRHRLVHFPKGPWYDFWTGKSIPGGKPLAWEVPLGRPAVFVRGGSLLTLGNPRNSTEEPLMELILAVYPGASGQWTLIEDDGNSNDYRQGMLAETRFTVTPRANAVAIEMARRQGLFQSPPRTFTLKVYLSRAPREFRFDGAMNNDWQWEATAGTVAFSYVDDGQAHQVEIAY